MDWQALYELRKTLESLGQQAAELFYDPDQERDDSGKWSGDGGSAGGSGGEKSDGGIASFSKAGATVDGRTVIDADNVPNQGSISATLDDYEIQPGIREVPMAAFGEAASTKNSFYAADDHRRVRELAARIKSSGEISPLIVIVDKDGPYVLEGGHRLSALYEIGAKSFPPLVVLDKTEATGVGG